MFDQKIPAQAMPEAENITYAPVAEPFVDVAKYSDGRILVDMHYLKAGRSGAIDVAYLRKSVADRLIEALGYLPEGITFKIYDAWRPHEVQESLYYDYFDRLKAENHGLDEEELHRLARTYVSYPDPSARFSYVHSSGGAVDLTLCDPSGAELDMGTAFDDFTERAAACALENGEPTTAMLSRRILFNAMTRAGFTNYPAEWWHYDFGDIFWSRITGKPVKYESVYSEKEMILEER